MQIFSFTKLTGLILLLLTLQVRGDDNPLLQYSQFPNFKQITAANFAPAMDSVLQEYYTTLDQASKAPPSWENTIRPLEDVTNNVARVWNIISFLNASNQTPEINSAYTTLLPKVTGFYNAIVRNHDLYNAFMQIRSGTEYANMTTDQQTLVNLTLKAFKLGGAELPAEQLNRYIEIIGKLDQLNNQFNSNLQNSIQAWQYPIPESTPNLLDGLPSYAKNAAAEKAKSMKKTGWIITLDDSMVNAVCSYAKDRDLRKTVYNAYITLASDQTTEVKLKILDNQPILKQILALRQELAILLGFNNYAELSLANNGATTPNAVLTFLNNLAIQVKPAAQKEFNKLQDYALNKDKIDKLEMWDLAYYAEMYKNDHFETTEEQTRKYFPEDTVFQGMGNIVDLIYGLKIEVIPNTETWNNSVKLFVVKDSKNNPYGYFYTDLYSSDGKNSGSYTMPYISRMKTVNNSLQVPVSIISTNFEPGNPGLLTHDEVITLFNEFGRMLEHTLSANNYISLTGSNKTESNTIEMVSEFMSKWSWQYQVIQDISRNISTGDDLPKDMLDDLHSRYIFDSGMSILRQVEMSLLDLRLHLNLPDDKNKSSLDILNEIRKQYSVVPYITTDRLITRFSNIYNNDNASGYYNFIFLDVMASDAYAAFSDSGFFNYATGSRFLNTIVAQSGQKSTEDLFTDFRGKPPSIVPYLMQYGIK